MPFLREYAIIKTGYQRTRILEDSNGTHWLIEAKDLNGNDSLDQKRMIRFTPERKPEQCIVKNGDILFKARGTNHFAHYIIKEYTNTLASDSFYLIRPNDNRLLPEYLAWWLNQTTAQRFFKSKAGTSLMSFISINELGKLKLEIPPLKIQEQIITINSLLNKEQLLAKKLNDFRQNLVKAACVKAANEKENL